MILKLENTTLLDASIYGYILSYNFQIRLQLSQNGEGKMGSEHPAEYGGF